jgi:uncharacterized phage protein (TIGR02218 family)
MATVTELYRFSEQASSSIWTFTSGNEVVTYDAGDGDEDYAPTSISRSEATVKNEIAKANIDVQISLDNEVAIRWMQDNGEKIVTLTIFERTKGGTFNVVWKGRLASISPGMNAVTLKMESIFTSLRRAGLRARYLRSCRHALYGRGCGLDPEDFAEAGTVSASDGKTFTIAEAATFDDGYFLGGMLRAPDGTLSYVVNHVGSAITVQRLSYALVEEINGGFPFTVSLYPGCDHSIETCDAKFNNKLNCGCFRHIPTKNPMGGGSIV